jgi:peptide subunit release factor 1 (eRF1)
MSRYDLSLLFSRTHSAQKSILSIYLNVDQGQSRNLNRGFETQLKKMVVGLRKRLSDVAERERFSVAMHHVQDFIAVYSPVEKGIVLFYDTTDGFFWHHALGFDVTDQIRWGRELFLQPLAAAMDELEACGLVLVDRTKLRLFLLSLGGIEEMVRENHDIGRVRHIKTSGFDNLDSSSHIQRKADNQVRANLRQYIREIDELVKARRLHRLILAGTEEITAALRGMLPGRLAFHVVGEIDLPITATPRQVLAAAKVIEGKYERATELEKVRTMITSVAKKGKAVTGLTSTLKAINSGRVWELVYRAGFVSPGYECPKCAALFLARATRCGNCGARPETVPDVVEKAVEHALRKQAKIEVVSGEAASELQAAGGVGAFLRTRTGTLAS